MSIFSVNADRPIDEYFLETPTKDFSALETKLKKCTFDQHEIRFEQLSTRNIFVETN